MTLFGGRLVDARVTAVTWTRTMQLERQQWVARRGTWLPPDGARNVEKHTETYRAAAAAPLSGGTGLPGSVGAPRRTRLRTRVYYTYEVQEWRKSRLLRASGNGPGDVGWPEHAPEPGERVRHQV